MYSFRYSAESLRSTRRRTDIFFTEEREGGSATASEEGIEGEMGGGRGREGAEGKGNSPVASELFYPVDDQSETEARRADGQKLRLLMLFYRK